MKRFVFAVVALVLVASVASAQCHGVGYGRSYGGFGFGSGCCQTPVVVGLPYGYGGGFGYGGFGFGGLGNYGLGGFGYNPYAYGGYNAGLPAVGAGFAAGQYAAPPVILQAPPVIVTAPFFGSPFYGSGHCNHNVVNAGFGVRNRNNVVVVRRR